MATPFTHTLRSLDRRRGPAFFWGLVGVLLLMGAWLVWFLFGDLAVHAAGSARLEADRRPHRLMSSVSAQVLEVAAELGSEVTAGQPLVRLDDETLRGTIALERATKASAEREAVSLQSQIEGERRRMAELRRSVDSASEEWKSRERQAVAELKDAEAEVERLRPLVDLGILGRAELERAEGKVSQLRPAADAQRQAVDRHKGEAGVELAAAEIQLEALVADLAQARGKIEEADAQLHILIHELEHYELPAPVDGTLGQMKDIRPGDVVAPGEVLGSVIPRGEIKIIADFEPSVAVGRIREGQSASMAFDGFPWTQFGRLQATVSKVALEPGSGRIRVELEPRNDSELAVPLQHGLPGTVEVEVERVAPAELVLRLAGRRFAGRRFGASQVGGGSSAGGAGRP